MTKEIEEKDEKVTFGDEKLLHKISLVWFIMSLLQSSKKL